MVFEVKHHKSAWGNRFVKTHNGGKPDDAVGYVGEGFFWKKRFADDELTPELKELGVTEEQWETICERLRDAMAFMGLGLDNKRFCKAIEDIDEEYFAKIGCKVQGCSSRIRKRMQGHDSLQEGGVGCQARIIGFFPSCLFVIS